MVGCSSLSCLACYSRMLLRLWRLICFRVSKIGYLVGSPPRGRTPVSRKKLEESQNVVE